MEVRKPFLFHWYIDSLDVDILHLDVPDLNDKFLIKGNTATQSPLKNIEKIT